MTEAEAPALRVLLEHFIDYAGLFPPAGLSLGETLANFASYQNGSYCWMLRNLVVPGADLVGVPSSLDGALSIIGEADNERAASLETKTVIAASRPVYCEVACGQLQDLDAIKAAGCFAKIRTGGLKPEAIPAASQVSAFILACAERRLPFKATAGLHHPIRATQALTYEDQAPRAVMHGFLNVMMASAFAWHGEKDIEPIVAETDASAFTFGQLAAWRNKSLTIEQIRQARQDFIHSVGSCSFVEPLADLQALGLLPEACTANT